MDFSEIATVTIRALSSLVVLFFTTKIIGKRQISELSLFDYVTGISIGNFAAEMTINTDSNEINGIYAVVLFGLCAYLISYLTMKSIKLRRFFSGTPTIIIQNGKLLSKNMNKVKIDINDLLEQLRMKGYFDLSEIEYAVMEVNGTISVLQKPIYKPTTCKDMKVKVEPTSIQANIIIDGEIMYNNLKKLNKTEQWLLKSLKVQGYNNIKDILLCTMDLNNKLTIYKGNESVEPINVLE